MEEAGGQDFLHVPSKNPFVFAARKVLWRNKVSEMNRKLILYAEKSSADAIVFFGTGAEIISPSTLHALSALKAKKVLWLIDTFFQGQPHPSIVTQCLPWFDLCLIVDAHYAPFYKQSGAKTVEVLDLVCDPEIHRHLNLTPEEKEIYGSPVVYIGNYFAQGSHRLALLLSLCEKFPVKLWGRGWEKTNEQAFKKAWTGKPVYGNEMCKVYSASRICLNMLPKESMNFLNMRIFEASACGTLVLTEHRERLAEAYAIGKEIESWKTQEELMRKIHYFLSHEDKRAQIAEAGQKRTLADHTYESRMKTLCSRIQELSSR